MINRIKELYNKISEPRVVRISYAIIYLCLLVAGLGVVFDSSPTLSFALDDIAVLACGSFVGLGGLVGLIFVFTPWWRWERLGALLCGTGILAYILTLVWVQFAPGSGNLIPSIFLFTALLTSIVLRWVALPRDIAVFP